MQLVPAVTELVISELLWLNYSAPDKPVYVYINSIGSQTPGQNQAVGFETEAYAILDTLNYIRPEIHTLAVGNAFGNAAMILASGKAGQRFALPNARISVAPPRMNRSFGNASNIMIKANELEQNTGTYVDFLSKFTGVCCISSGHDDHYLSIEGPISHFTLCETATIDKCKKIFVGCEGPAIAGRTII